MIEDSEGHSRNAGLAEDAVCARRKADQTVKEESSDEEDKQDVGDELFLQVVAALGKTQENIRNIMDEEDVAANTSLHVQTRHADKEDGCNVVDDVFNEIAAAGFSEDCP